MTEREEAIGRIMRRTGKTREQAVAFLDVLGSAFRRRGWAEGEPLDGPQITERLGTFLGVADACGESQQLPPNDGGVS